jgi:hypothetical protein
MASSQAKEIYDCLHSNNQTGAAHKDVPPWAQQFFRLFEAQKNLPSASTQAAETRNERRSVMTGLIGWQAPLGNHPNQRPFQLRTETSRNIGTPRQRQMNMGDFNMEVVGEDTINNERMEDEFLVEGLDDTVIERPACWRQINNNGVRCWNRNIDFGAGRNDPAARFQHVTHAFSSLDALTNAVAQLFSAPSVAPTRTLTNVALDFKQATDMLVCAQDRNDTVAVQFYESIRQRYMAEQRRFGTTGNAE